VFYVKFYLGSIRSPSYNFRRQINRPNCTISSLVSNFFSTRYAPPHSLKLQIKQPNCTISNLVCPIFLWLATLDLTILNNKYIYQIASFQALCVTFVYARPQGKLSNSSYVIATIENRCHCLITCTHADTPPTHAIQTYVSAPYARPHNIYNTNYINAIATKKC
jgi:hypothetical protein